jgi:ribonuclease P protein subunit RPR2
MARGKAAKPSVGAPNKHLYSRMSYLYQAAFYLSAPHIHQAPSSDAQPGANVAGEDSHGPASFPEMPNTEEGFEASNSGSRGSKHHGNISLTTLNMPLSRRLLSNLRAISRKGQIRLSPSIKRSICKRCETLLIPGSTSTHRVDNPSRGGKKPWADVLVVQCIACGTEKRFPVGAKKQLGRKLRERGEELAGATEDHKAEGGYVLWSERPDVVIDTRTEDAANAKSD